MITRPALKHACSLLITDAAVHCLLCAEQASLSKSVHKIHKTRLARTHLASYYVFFFTFLFSSKLYNFLVSFNFLNFRNENSYNVLESDWGGCKSNPNQPKKLNFNESASFQRSKAIQKKKEKKKKNKKKNQK